MAIAFGSGIPDAIEITKDEKYPDCIYLELLFTYTPRDVEFGLIHKRLQKVYGFNFPVSMRRKILLYPRTFSFFGIKNVSLKEAMKHDRK